MKGTREKILQAALVEIEAFGLLVTTKQIARRAGVNELTLFRHFETKQQLIISAVGQLIGPAASLELHISGDAHVDFSKVALQYVYLVDKHPGLLVQMLSTNDEELLDVIVKPLQQRIAQNLTKLMQFYVHQGLLDDEVATEDLVREFMGPLLARAFLRRAVDMQTFDVTSYVSRFISGHQT